MKTNTSSHWAAQFQHAWARAIVPMAVVTLIFLAACQPGVAPTVNTSASTPGTAAASETTPAKLIVYSGRSENLVGPLIERFEQESGIDVEVRYGETAELAATLLEEGENSPADVFFSQDAGALGALTQAGRLTKLSEEVLDVVEPRFRCSSGEWVGVSGRARVLVYNTDELQESDLPTDVAGLGDPKWRGKVGWAPTNASFQAFVTAMRRLNGEDATRQWLEAMVANDVQVYDGNAPIVEAVGNGEILAGLVNHYYLYRFLAEQGEQFPARNHFFRDGGADALVNVAGVGVLNTARNPDAAFEFVRYLLTDAAQQYFADETVEYPLASTAATLDPRLTPLAELKPPALDLSDLSDLQGTLALLQETGALP